jgi:hypothetical protein
VVAERLSTEIRLLEFYVNQQLEKIRKMLITGQLVGCPGQCFSKVGMDVFDFLRGRGASITG